MGCEPKNTDAKAANQGLQRSRACAILLCGVSKFPCRRTPTFCLESESMPLMPEISHQDAVTMFGTPLEGVKNALYSAQEGDCLVLLALTQRGEVTELVQEFVGT